MCRDHYLTLEKNYISTDCLVLYSASRFYDTDEAEWSLGQPASDEEAKRTEKECRGHGPALHEQEQSPRCP